MSADDDADCVEHVWLMQGVTLTMAGSQIDSECTRCGALMVETGADLTGRRPRR